MGSYDNFAYLFSQSNCEPHELYVNKLSINRSALSMHVYGSNEIHLSNEIKILQPFCLFEMLFCKSYEPHELYVNKLSINRSALSMHVYGSNEIHLSNEIKILQPFCLCEMLFCKSYETKYLTKINWLLYCLKIIIKTHIFFSSNYLEPFVFNTMFFQEETTFVTALFFIASPDDKTIQKGVINT